MSVGWQQISLKECNDDARVTRRRPQKFDDLVGQEFVAETLKNSIKSGKIAHAYLFSGPRGCGKTSTARILAKALNCAEGPTDCPCGRCSNCQEITKGSSLDVIEIDGASNTSVENIRQIKDEVLFPPSNCRYKIYIIDEVHMLSTSAFNALLKTIEEPPPYVIFIFATTELQKVPATIKSRCQQFNFRLVAIDKVKQCLSDAANELNIQADDEALFWIARESTGSMRDAYTLFDQVVAFSDGHITYNKIRDKLGLVGIDRLNTLFEACANSQQEQVISLLDDFLQNGISLEQLISNSADYLRSLLLIKSGISKESLLGNNIERYSKIVLNAWNTIQIERALSIYLQLYRDIRYSISPRYEIELAFSRLCFLSQYVSNIDVKKAIDSAQSLLSKSSSQVIEKQNSPENNVQNQTSEQNISGTLRFSNSMMSQIQNDENQSESQGETQNPFSDGGPLPPEQSVEKTETVKSAPVLDERLKLNIPQLNENQESEPKIFIPHSETGYSVNPDSQDSEFEDWTNTDEPPEETYFPEEDFSSYEENFLEEESQSQNVPAQLEEKLQTGDGRIISVAQLKGSVKAALEITDGFAASNIDKTGEWKVQNSVVETTVQNSYDLEIIKRKIPIIAKEISSVCSKQMEFKVILKKEDISKKENNEELPVQVKLLLNAFKGNIIR